MSREIIYSTLGLIVGLAAGVLLEVYVVAPLSLAAFYPDAIQLQGVSPIALLLIVITSPILAIVGAIAGKRYGSHLAKSKNKLEDGNKTP